MNRSVLLIMVFLVMVLSFSWASGSIHFECENLEEAIREARGYTGDSIGPIYPKDVQAITDLLYVETDSLEGIQHLTNLLSLYVWFAPLSDITPLQNLTNLVRLTFIQTRVTDISALKNLTNLEYLNFSGNRVREISPLSHLTNLQKLSFTHNRVRDITPLQGLINLIHLDLSYNEVSDISPLQPLTNLEVLHFTFNEVSDLTPLQNLINLRSLWFQYNQVSDISALVANPGFGQGESDQIDMLYNNLDLTPGSQNMNDINTLIGRGVDVQYDPQN